MTTVVSVHGTCVEIKGKAVLISGKPGVGKSSLALQLIDRGAILVADDQTLLSLEGGCLIARPPLSLKGLMEVRGVGICPFPYQEQSPFALSIEISEGKKLERLPKPTFVEYYGIKIPHLKLERDDPLGAIKIELKVNFNDEQNT